MIKLARIDKITDVFVDLKIEDKKDCLNCQNNCNKSLMRFMFNYSNQRILTVDRKKGPIAFHKKTHLIDEYHFFSSSNKVDEVIGIKFNESNLFQLSLALYGLPIILMVVFLMIGYHSFTVMGLNSDLGGALGAVLGLIIAKKIIKSKNNKLKPKVEFFK